MKKAVLYSYFTGITKLKTVLSMIVLMISLALHSQNTPPKENGWYYITDNTQDSLSETPIVTIKDFVVLRLESDASGKSVITGSVSKHKRDKWADATERSIGKRIGFVFEGKVITAPQVNARIKSGNFQICNPHNYNLQEIYNGIRQEKIDAIEALFKGWEKDSISYSSKEKADSLLFAMDYWETSEWIDMSTHPENHYWWGNLDTLTYNKLETALHQELRKSDCSSHAEDYMKSDAYKAYKTYLYRNPDCINLLFQGFLFAESPTGLYGLLIDDIVQSRYPAAPSLWKMAAGTDNKDDEMFVKLKYQKAVWRLMNEERKNK